MSGGSYDYLYLRVEDAANQLVSYRTTPERQAFAAHLRLVAQALHDIEWVDSCDMGPGDEDPAIRAVISAGQIVAAAECDVREAIARWEAAVERDERTDGV